MKKHTWLILFAVVLAADIIGIETNHTLTQWISKPLLMPVLMLYFFTAVPAAIQGAGRWIAAALFFSLLGDVLLMLQGGKELYFLLGLSAFLLAHIFYILFFNQLRLQEKIPGNPWFLLLVVIYYGLLIGWLSPYLNAGLKIPVRIYGVVICIMLMLALHMRGLKQGTLFITGAAMFVLSDSLLAINKFYQPLPAAGLLVMFTYGAAQFLIVKGAIEYLRSYNTQH